MDISEKTDISIALFRIFLPTLTSFIICFITLYFSNKNHKKTFKQQNEYYNKSLHEANKKFQEQQKMNEENQRLKHLPYLTLVPQHRIHRFEGDMTIEDNIISIPFNLVNEGAGAAFSVHLKYLSKEERPLSHMFVPIAYEHNCNDGYDILGVRAPIDTDILGINKTTEFCLHLSALDTNCKEIQPSTDIRWTIFIIFQDIQEREYCQKYTFYTSTRGNKIFRVNSYMPQLVKKESFYNW